MPFQAPSWTEFYTCPICENEFSTNQRLPISLGCGHTICRVCLATVYSRQCPFDQTSISTDVDNLPINNALLQLLNSGDGNDNDGNGNERTGNATASNATTSNSNNANNNHNNNGKTLFGSNSDNDSAAGDQQQMPPSVRNLKPEDFKCYKSSKKCIEELAQYLKSFVTNSGSNLLTRPMLRKLVTLVNCQLMEEEGRIRAVRTSRFLGERTVTELLLQHQNPQQLSLCLWAAVRSRGCQFLGPSMQEEVLKLVLQALENGSALSRKVLVMYVVQRLIDNFLPASKTSIGHVVQLLYRASCFKVSKREGDSSLMQLKEEFRDYEALRREHDAQIVQIATEAGLRIAPDQWSSLLYGNTSHKSHMQSICDTLQTPSSFAQSVQELVLALQRTGDPTNLSNLRPHLKHLASIDPSLEGLAPSWQDVERALDAVRHVVLGLVKFMQFHSNRKVQDYPVPPVNANGKYKISLCRDLTERRMCPRGTNCTFAHSAEERQRYRAKHRRTGGPVEKTITRPPSMSGAVTSSGSQAFEQEFSNNQNQQQQQNEGITGHHSQQQHQNQSLGHATSPSDIQLNSPIKIKTSPMRKYANNDGNGSLMRPNMLMGDGTFVGGLSNATSPLHMQLHASPIPPPPPGGHMLGLNAPTPIINVPPLHHHPHHQHHSFENMPFGSINYSGGGKFVRMPNMGMTLPPPPTHVRPTNLRGPISNTGAGGAGGGGGLSPRSSMHNPINMTTVVNPPNLQGTNSSNKPPASPLHKNLYNNPNIAGEFYNSGPPYFANSNLERKPQIASNASPMWDAQQQQQQQQHQQQQQQQHQQCQPINPSDFITNQHHLMFMQPPPPQPQSNQHQLTSESNVFFDKPPPQQHHQQQPTTSNLDDASLRLSDNFMFKTTKNNFLETPPGHHQHHLHNSQQSLKDLNKKGSKISLMHQDKSNMFWHPNANPMQNNSNFNSNPAITTNSNNINNNGVVNIEPSPSTSLFRDRESFVRSDSILDDDAATFDVPPTSTAALGNKYGPICPMYKGLITSSTSPNHHTTNSFVDSWNALIMQDNENQLEQECAAPHNQKDFRSVFSLDNDMPQTSDLTVPAAIAAASSSQTSTAFDNYNNMQAAFSKLSLNFINDQRNEQQQLNHFNFDLDPLDHILNPNNFSTDMGKNSSINDDLLWNNSGVNSNSSKQSTINLSLNSFWSDNTTNASPASTSVASLINNMPLTQQQQQQQHQRMSQNLEDTELDITEIVDKIWPCGDDSGIKLD